MRARVAFFTATMGGAGHIAAAATIGRGLARQGFEGEYRMFGPAVPYEAAQLDNYVEAKLSREEQRDPALAQESALAAALVDYDPDLILVDMFWFPIRGILPMLRAEAWLMLHTMPRTWLRGPPKVRFEPGQYKRIMATEPLRYHTLPERLDPLVICNPDECHPPHALKERLGLDPGSPLTLVVQTGFGGEVDEILAGLKASGESVVTMSMHNKDAIFPIAPWLLGADRIVGGGGYHFFWEVVWLGLRDRAIFNPFFRTIDHQKWRVEHCLDHEMRRNGADVLARRIVAG